MRSALLALPLAVVFLWRLSVMVQDEPGAGLLKRWADAQFWADETTAALIVAGLGTTGLAIVHTEARRLWVVSRTGAMDAGVVVLVTLALVAARADRSMLVLVLAGLSVVGLAGRGGLARRAGLSTIVAIALLAPLEAQSPPLPSGIWPTPLWVGDGHLAPDLLTGGIGFLFSLAVALQSPIEECTSGSWLVRFGLPVWIVCGVVVSTGALKKAYSERAAPGWTSLEQLAPLASVATCEDSLVEGGEQWLLDGGAARRVYIGRRSGEPNLVAPPNGRMDAVFSLAGGPLASARLVVRAGSAAGVHGLRVCPIEVHSFVGGGRPLNGGCFAESAYVLVCSKGERSERLTTTSRNPWPDGGVVAQTGDVTSIFVPPDAGVGDTLRLVSDAKRLLGATGPWVFSSLSGADASAAVSLKRSLSQTPKLSVRFSAQAADGAWIGYARVVSTLWACRASLPPDLVLSLRVNASGAAGGVDIEPDGHKVFAVTTDCLADGLPGVIDTIGELRAEVHWGDGP